MNQGILVASFGTSYAETRKKCIEPIEKLVKEKYGEDNFERAFTSSIIRKKLKNRDNLHIYSPEEGLQSLLNKGFSKITTLSLHILDGIEYSKLSNEYGPVAEPLLFNNEDYLKIASDENINDFAGNDAIIFMGHGSEDTVADKTYNTLQETYNKLEKNDIFIGTVEGTTTINEILEKIKNKNYKSILLKPFMVVAGDHAQNDMASDEDDSWKTILENHGYIVNIDLRGLGEYELVRNMFLEKLEKAIN